MKKYDFAFIFSAKNCNPNGDFDADNMPRTHEHNRHGLVSDVAIKRKIRDCVESLGSKIYCSKGKSLEENRGVACEDGQSTMIEEIDEKGKKSKKKNKEVNVEDRAKRMCEEYWDVRTFGAVMSQKENNCGQVRGPVQISFSESVDAINPKMIVITSSSYQSKKREEKTDSGSEVGRKWIIPYGLYVGYGHINPFDAEKWGFNEKDLELLWEAIIKMFEVCNSSSKTGMSLEKLYVFEHESSHGNAPAHKLFELIKIEKTKEGSENYEISIQGNVANGVKIFEDDDENYGKLREVIFETNSENNV